MLNKKYKNTIQLLYLYLSKEDELQPHHDAMNGFIKTLHIEHAKLACKTLEIQEEKPVLDNILDIVLTELSEDDPKEMTVRYKGQDRYVRKLKELDFGQNTPSILNQGVRLKEKGVYLITGGAGGLGLIFAEYLAKEYKARLVLTGRAKLTAEREAKLDGFRKLGAEVTYCSADVSNIEDAINLVEECKSLFGEINGIIHSAGVLRDAYIRNKTPEELDAVFAPKVFGTVNLDKVTKTENLDFFVMFSSMAAISGTWGKPIILLPITSWILLLPCGKTIE
ncbi:MAG: SDR family NAD(P)-dependent oxidoreductase [Bacteroidales bacterium]|nr:SDR family NAD(P)-dependent oxidoreductase [Bacteroidales bacterium]